MSDIPKKKMRRNPIFICADVWLGIFPFLPPRQLGLRMALVGDRFDQLVDGHFGMRQWTFGHLKICGIIAKDGTKEMKIGKLFNSSWESLPIPDEDIPLPDRVIGFECIEIKYIDQNVMAFLRRIRRIFEFSQTNLDLFVHWESFDEKYRISPIIWHIIWPLIKGSIFGIKLSYSNFTVLYEFAPTIFRDCPNHRTFVSCEIYQEPYKDIPKWLCTPRGDGIPKLLTKCGFDDSQVDELRRQFANSSSPVNFIAIFAMPNQSYYDIVSFDLINEVTGERLAFKPIDNDVDEHGYRDCLLIRCPISRDEKQWAEWEEEAIGFKWEEQWDKIRIDIGDDGIGDGFTFPLDSTINETSADQTDDMPTLLASSSASFKLLGQNGNEGENDVDSSDDDNAQIEGTNGPISAEQHQLKKLPQAAELKKEHKLLAERNALQTNVAKITLLRLLDEKMELANKAFHAELREKNAVAELNELKQEMAKMREEQTKQQKKRDNVGYVPPHLRKQTEEKGSD